jgi:hypothetical protein
MDGEYVAADAYINDAMTIEMIDRGERLDASAGYVSKDDRTPGTWRGQQYDLIQRNIVGNHVALCPPNRGRAGPDVGLRLDSLGAWCAISNGEEPGEKIMKLIKLDGKDFEFGSDAHIEKLEELHKSELASVKAEADTARAKLDAVDAEQKKRSEDEEAERAKRAFEKEETEKKTKARMKRALRAARIMEEDDEEKLDGLLDQSDRDVMIAAIKHCDPKFDKLDETDDYLRARFDALEVPAGRDAGVGGVVTELRKVRLDAADADASDPVEKARLAMVERNKNAWKTK